MILCHIDIIGACYSWNEGTPLGSYCQGVYYLYGPNICMASFDQYWSLGDCHGYLDFFITLFWTPRFSPR